MSLGEAGIGAGGSLMGTMVGGAIGLYGDKKAFSRQKWMASHAHQLEVADLKAAGLNPILSGMGGSGASASQVSNTVGSSAMSGANVGQSTARLIGQELDTMEANAEASRAVAASNLATARETKRRTDLEYGSDKSVSIQDPRTGEMIGGREPGLRELEAKANIQLITERAKQQGYSNVRDAIKAGVYKEYPWAVPAEMILDQAGNIKGLLPKGGKKGGK